MQPYLREEKRTVAPKRAMEILAKHGTHISEDTAEQMLDFLYKLSNLSVSEAILSISRQKDGIPLKNRKS